MGVDSSEFKKRTMRFAVLIVQFVGNLPKTTAAQAIAGQLVRSGTSVGSNYRAACRARSRAEFLAKMGIVEEEADESLYWMELLIKSGQVESDKLKQLLQKANEILSLTVSSIRTARSRT